jgi:rod shape determining protein RodA
MILHRFLSKLDLGIVAAAFLLMGASLATLASVSETLFNRQLIWVTAAAVLIVGLPQLNLRAIFNYRWLILGIYFAVLVLLIVTYFIAPAINGTRSWLVVGPVQIQASEFMKAALIVLFSSFFAVRHVAIAELGVIISSFVYFIVPALFVLLQPDLGTTLVLLGLWFGYLLVSGLPWRYIFSAIVIFVVLAFLGWNFALADYQKARITALFQPEADPLGVNYSVLQSKIAIGSGGFWGKGFGQGSQVKLGFLPAAGTDFVFSSFTEEWGLVGGLILIGIFTFLIYRVLQLGLRSSSNFPRFVALGTALLFFIHFTINLGSALGLLPVIGIGFPFLSYGGSGLLTMAALLGIVQGVSEKRGI